MHDQDQVVTIYKNFTKEKHKKGEPCALADKTKRLFKEIENKLETSFDKYLIEELKHTLNALFLKREVEIIEYVLKTNKSTP